MIRSWLPGPGSRASIAWLGSLVFCYYLQQMVSGAPFLHCLYSVWWQWLYFLLLFTRVGERVFTFRCYLHDLVNVVSFFATICKGSCSSNNNNQQNSNKNKCFRMFSWFLALPKIIHFIAHSNEMNDFRGVQKVWNRAKTAVFTVVLDVFQVRWSPTLINSSKIWNHVHQVM